MKLAIVCLAASTLIAQESSSRTTVRAHGEATVSATPDQARIDIGVVSQAATAQLAGTQNAKQVTDVIAEIKKALGASAEIQTVNYSLQPNYKYSRDGAAPTITGYSASNTVQVKTGDLPGVSKVIDASTRAGANTIHGIQFGLKDEQKLRGEALRQATVKALANATALAQAVQKRIDRVVRIEDGDPSPIRPVARMEMMQRQAADAAPTPVEPGTIDVRATVTLTAELTQ